ncbi:MULTISPECIES: NADH-quinone oxidoreductase subunit NuoK [Desulfovibrio]|uniref:NADH-quinone oxidoreductase subunit K n=3 Tax=Desulfovibrio TaxID=872 RepID=NUOK_DESDA|nr:MULTISPECIES: NADH-quinone oxidoreductase subunit NuoK [Desulfovibrio]B8J1D0.1 RecName: Full=NADH-quinone oxidoreductase subunit K; AltName: Full=NADH dehydrogenase I subunit K; AltName: Full=NDH-1 subunit K [Desulfovibrio desulfuricans ATCC 27774]ATD80769.1 NADH-quinone oxidoreductase subunit K [Desulfovibrio sp. G11]MDY0202509.1 NADH-quinone oxidoreductase subunit NuoK [Desulfovibrio desulfuricans]SFW64833.1 NADH dehydrogenase subunit K [Desulfovibrio desulfuricans]SPD36309.1 NADH:ubiquin
MIPLSWYMALATVLFCIGVAGFLTRRNIIVMLLSLELMLNGVNLNLVAMSYFMDSLRGHVFTLFVITVAACEAAVGLGIVICLFRSRRTVRNDNIVELRG